MFNSNFKLRNFNRRIDEIINTSSAGYVKNPTPKPGLLARQSMQATNAVPGDNTSQETNKVGMDFEKRIAGFVSNIRQRRLDILSSKIKTSTEEEED